MKQSVLRRYQSDTYSLAEGSISNMSTTMDMTPEQKKEARTTKMLKMVQDKLLNIELENEELKEELDFVKNNQRVLLEQKNALERQIEDLSVVGSARNSICSDDVYEIDRLNDLKRKIAEDETKLEAKVQLLQELQVRTENQSDTNTKAIEEIKVKREHLNKLKQQLKDWAANLELEKVAMERKEAALKQKEEEIRISQDRLIAEGFMMENQKEEMQVLQALRVELSEKENVFKKKELQFKEEMAKKEAVFEVAKFELKDKENKLAELVDKEKKLLQREKLIQAETAAKEVAFETAKQQIIEQENKLAQTREALKAEKAKNEEILKKAQSKERALQKERDALESEKAELQTTKATMDEVMQLERQVRAKEEAESAKRSKELKEREDALDEALEDYNIQLDALKMIKGRKTRQGEASNQNTNPKLEKELADKEKNLKEREARVAAEKAEVQDMLKKAEEREKVLKIGQQSLAEGNKILSQRRNKALELLQKAASGINDNFMGVVNSAFDRLGEVGKKFETEHMMVKNILKESAEKRKKLGIN